MKGSKGFTIIELVVALLVLSLVIVTAISFFVYQSGYGRESTKQKTARESIALAMMMIRQDVMHAGYGVYDKPVLALRLEDYTPAVDENGKLKYPAAYRELFVNYGKYLDGDYSPTNYNIFSSHAYFNGWGNSSLTTNLNPIDIGCLLIDTGGVVNFTDKQFTEPDTYTYTLDSALSLPDFSGSPNYAPAICYKLEPRDATKPFNADTNPYTKLTRNGEVILGGEPQFEVNDFRVRAMFYDPGGVLSAPPGVKGDWWSPDCGGEPNCVASLNFQNALSNSKMALLRMVEVTVVYRLSQQRMIRDTTTNAPPTEQWTRDYKRTIRVSPRVVVLSKY